VSEHFDVNELPATAAACGGGEIKDTRAFTSCKAFSCAEQKLRENASAPAAAQHLLATTRGTESNNPLDALPRLCPDRPWHCEEAAGMVFMRHQKTLRNAGEVALATG
jgi:hypothetical protein